MSSDDHLPAWTQGDATDPRGQLFRLLKFDQGLVAAAGMPLIFKNPGYVFGQVALAGLAPNSVDSSKIVDGSIVNADVNAAAAIAYSKLNLANSIVTGDIVNGTILDADIAAAGTAEINWQKMAQSPTFIITGGGPTGAIVTGTLTNLLFLTDDFINSTYFTVTGGAGVRTGFTAAVSGVFAVHLDILWPANAANAGVRECQILIAGATAAYTTSPANPVANRSSGTHCAVILRINAGTAITANCFHTQGANQTIAAGSPTRLSAVYLGHQ